MKNIFLLFIILSIQAQAILGGRPLETNHQLRGSVVGIMEHYLNTYWFTNATGSVIGDRFILTAAHVLFDKFPDVQSVDHFIVNFSDKQISPRQDMQPADESTLNSLVTRKVVAIKIHPLFKGKVGKHDLALLMLDNPIPVGVKPVRILYKDKLDIIKKGKNTLFLAGTGVINDLYEHNDLVNFATVTARYENNSIVTLQRTGSGACKGDSGGPAFIYVDEIFYQVGVISGPNEGSRSCREEGLLSSVSNEKNFIEDSIKEFRNQQIINNGD